MPVPLLILLASTFAESYSAQLQCACDPSTTQLVQNMTAVMALNMSAVQNLMSENGLTMTQLNVQNCPASGVCTPTAPENLSGVYPMCLIWRNANMTYRGCHFSPDGVTNDVVGLAGFFYCNTSNCNANTTMPVVTANFQCACDPALTQQVQNLLVPYALNISAVQDFIGEGYTIPMLNVQTCPASGVCTPTAPAGIPGVVPACVIFRNGNNMVYRGCHFQPVDSNNNTGNSNGNVSNYPCSILPNLGGSLCYCNGNNCNQNTTMPILTASFTCACDTSLAAEAQSLVVPFATDMAAAIQPVFGQGFTTAQLNIQSCPANSFCTPTAPGLLQQLPMCIVFRSGNFAYRGCHWAGSVGSFAMAGVGSFSYCNSSNCNTNASMLPTPTAANVVSTSPAGLGGGGSTGGGPGPTSDGGGGGSTSPAGGGSPTPTGGPPTPPSGVSSGTTTAAQVVASHRSSANAVRTALAIVAVPIVVSSILGRTANF